MRSVFDVKRPGLVPGWLMVAALLLAPHTAVGVDRMVLGEYFTATW